MFINILALALETLSYALFINCAMGLDIRKQFPVWTYVYVLVSIIFIEWINHFSVDYQWSMLVYLFSFAYCYFMAKDISRAFFASVSGIVVITFLEMILLFPLFFIQKYFAIRNDYFSLIINGGIFAAVVFFLVYKKWDVRLCKVYEIIKRRMYFLALILACFLIFLYEIRTRTMIGSMLFFRFLIYVLTILAIVLLWHREVVENLKQKYENEQLLLYSQAYDSALKNLQARQHEFNNHLNNIANMHVVHKDYESLVNSQREYVRELKESYQFRDVLNIKQPVLSGFLYLEFTKYEDVDADVLYRIETEDVTSFMPVVELIEILAALMDNAFQELAVLPEAVPGKFCLDILEEEENLEIRVKNTIAEDIPYHRLIHFCDRGYSTKEPGHGMGLFNAKNMILKHSGKISIETAKIQNEYWICFTCSLKRKKKP